MIGAGWFRSNPQSTPPESPGATLERLLGQDKLDFKKLTRAEIKVVTERLDSFSDEQLESLTLPAEELRRLMSEAEYRVSDEGIWTAGRTFKVASLGILQTAAGGCGALLAGIGIAPLPFVLLGAGVALGFGVVNFLMFNASYRKTEEKALDEFLITRVEPQLSIRQMLSVRLVEKTGRMVDTTELEELSEGEERLRDLRDNISKKARKDRRQEPHDGQVTDGLRSGQRRKKRLSKKRRESLRRRNARLAEGFDSPMVQDDRPNRRRVEIPLVDFTGGRPSKSVPEAPIRQQPLEQPVEEAPESLDQITPLSAADVGDDDNDAWLGASDVPHPVLDSDLLTDDQTDGTESQRVVTGLYRQLSAASDTWGRPLISGWDEFKTAFSGIPDHVRRNYSEMVTAYSHLKKLEKLQGLVPGVKFSPVHFEPLYREGCLQDDPLQEVPPKVTNVNDARYLGYSSVAACNESHTVKWRTGMVKEYFELAEELLVGGEPGFYPKPLPDVLASKRPTLTTVPVEAAKPVAAKVQTEPVVQAAEPKPLGFANLGSTCFANSSLKAVFGAYPESYFDHLRMKRFDDENRERVRVAFLGLLDAYHGHVEISLHAGEELKHLFEACRQYGESQVTRHAFKEIFKAGGHIPQSDAQEFIQPLLAVLGLDARSECSVVISGQIFIDMSEMGLDVKFWKPLRQAVNEAGDGRDHTGILPVQIPVEEGKTIQDAVNRFLDIEQLEKGNRITCTLEEAVACGYQRNVKTDWVFDGESRWPYTEKSLSLEANLENFRTLGVQLKLFKEQQGVRGLSTKKLTEEGGRLFQNSDEFLELAIKNTVDGKRYKVKMQQKSMCFHGGSFGGGHYTAALRTGGGWDHHNDHKITPGHPSAKDASHSQAYIIFYEVDGEPELIEE
ncbi:MAG: hypothetical protein ACR2PT_14850 [Endozoicomonas sp.]